MPLESSCSYSHLVYKHVMFIFTPLSEVWYQGVECVEALNWNLNLYLNLFF